MSTAAGSSTFSIVGQAGDTATTQLSELNSALGAFGISASLDKTGTRLQFRSAYNSVAAPAGRDGNNGVNTARTGLTYDTGQPPPTAPREPYGDHHLAAGLYSMRRPGVH